MTRPPAQKKPSFSLWFAIVSMNAFGYCGLLVCYFIGKIVDVKISSDNPSLLFFAMLFFSAFMTIGLLVLLPIQVLYFERKTRKTRPPEKMTVEDVVGLPFGASNPNAVVPKWISIPVKIFFWAVVSLFVLFVGFVLLGLGLSYFFGPNQ